MNPPLISIIIPSYNQGQFLLMAIQSVLSQEYPYKELIVIDGGSQDASLEIINSFSSRLAYWESTPDRGQSHAINKGFERASGDIITFLSADDFYLPGTFKHVAELWRAEPACGAIVGGFHFIDEHGQLSAEAHPPRLPYPSPLDLSLLPPGDWRMHQVSTFYTWHALDQVGRYVREDLHYVMDRELLFRVCKQFEIILDGRPYAAFRRHAASKSMSAGVPFGEEFAQLYLEHKSRDKREDKFREEVAKFYRAKGYIHVAKYHPHLVNSTHAFIKALTIDPCLIVNKNFLKALAKRYLKFFTRQTDEADKIPTTWPLG